MMTAADFQCVRVLRARHQYAFGVVMRCPVTTQLRQSSQQVDANENSQQVRLRIPADEDALTPKICVRKASEGNFHKFQHSIVMSKSWEILVFTGNAWIWRS